MSDTSQLFTRRERLLTFVIALMTSSYSSKEDFVTFFEGFQARAPLQRLPNGHAQALSQATEGPPDSTARIVLDAGANAYYLYSIAKQTAVGRHSSGQAAAKSGLEQFDRASADLRRSVAVALTTTPGFSAEMQEQAKSLISPQSRKRPRK